MASIAEKNKYLEPEQKRLRHISEATLRRVHEIKCKAVALIGEIGTIAGVARALKVDASTIWRYKREDPDFAAAIEAQIARIGDLVEDNAIAKVLTPGTKTIFFQGEPCGVEVVHHDALHLALLRGLKPNRYRESNGGINLQVNQFGVALLPVAAASDDEWAAQSLALTDMQNKVSAASAETIDSTAEEVAEPMVKRG